MSMYRQGDLLIQRINEFPAGRIIKSFTENNETILLHGEATGHSHTLKGSFDLYRNDTNAAFLDITGEAKIVHEEHKTIELPIGKYAVIRQREYTPKEIVYVRD